MEAKTMKLRKLLAFFFLLPLLISCGSDSIAGTYAFQMGKENGTHFGIFLNITDNPYEENNEYKDLSLDLSLSFPSGDDSEETTSMLDAILEYFKDKASGIYTIPGYYKVTDQTDKQGASLLKIGISFKYVKEKIIEVYKENTGEDLSPNSLDSLETLNNNDIIQSILYMTYKDNKITVYLPVGYEDVYYQLYWYGYDVQINLSYIMGGGSGGEDESFIKVVPTEPHTLGSHPTKAEVATINETFKQTHEGLMFETYRDYNVLEMGLTKK